MTFLVDVIAMVLAIPRIPFPAIGVMVLGGGDGIATVVSGLSCVVILCLLV